ncbi:hypothetical protein Pmani_000315 [Petrolisthes manimaculis]|uniref:Ionotropic glutamate receptor C-terminal domain-containing protein n=1 Tax=Petrolisthes manimaculis TaxID=1843537 RepID=A0AAE1QMA0_9EUCA|nr:hypothetical protein Pmani_000315 [Petrolisthes manimaculis]
MTGEVWLAVVVIAAVWGTTLWLFQKVWPLALGGKRFSFNLALFYSWGIMLEDPPTRPPNNLTGQLLVGWWLTGCLVITSSYRSSLISHIVVQGKSSAINSVEELIDRDGWSWGAPDMTGAFNTFFSTNPNPAMQKLYKQVQVKSIEEGMRLVIGSKFAFLYNNYLYMQTLLSTRYTDKTGYTPIHASATKYQLFSGNSFAIRPGAIFLRHFDLTRIRLLETGLMSFWIDDVLNTRKTRVRQEQRRKDESDVLTNFFTFFNFLCQIQDKRQVVLSVEQLLGTFLMLGLGSILACVSLIAEIFTVYN